MADAFLTDIKSAVRTLIKDDPSSTADYVISNTILGTAISDFALLEFSRARPYKVKKQYVGLSESSYALPSDWVDDFSQILAIEYPLGEQIPAIMESKDYELYEPDTSNCLIGNVSTAATSVTCSTASQAIFFMDGDVITVGDDSGSETSRVTVDGNGTTGVVGVSALGYARTSGAYIKKQKCIRFLLDMPSTSEAFMVHYTTVHTLTESAITISAMDKAAFKMLSAAIVCELIAANFGYSSDSSLSADNVDYLAKAELWQRKAENFRTRYNDALGESDKASAPASARAEWDISLPWGSEHVNHPYKWR